LSQLEKILHLESIQKDKVREALDSSMEAFEDIVEHCSQSANIVCGPVFESAASKIQCHQILNEEPNLSPEESWTAKFWKYKSVKVLDQQIVEVDDDEHQKDDTDILLAGIKQRKNRSTLIAICRLLVHHTKMHHFRTSFHYLQINFGINS
jgi:hypothetical protein